MEEALYQEELQLKCPQGAIFLLNRALRILSATNMPLAVGAPLFEEYYLTSSESYAELTAHLASGATEDMLIATGHGTLLVLCGLYAQTGLLPVVLPPEEIAALLEEPAELAPSLSDVRLCAVSRRRAFYHTGEEHRRVKEWCASWHALLHCKQERLTLPMLRGRLAELAGHLGATLILEGGDAFSDGSVLIDAPIMLSTLLLALIMADRTGGERPLLLRLSREGREGVTMHVTIQGNETAPLALPEPLFEYARERGAILELYTPWDAPHLTTLSVTVSPIERSEQGVKQEALWQVVSTPQDVSRTAADRNLFFM